MSDTKKNSPVSSLLQHERLRVPGMYLSFMARHFVHDRILMSAGSLAFQTLLSLVPLMAVTLSILKVFPVFASLKQYIGDFLFQNFAPAKGLILKGYLWEFIDKTSSLSTVGGLFLIVIVLFLISTIDQTLNDIWEVQTPRRRLQGFTLYWTVLTLGPVFIGTSVLASSYVWYSVFAEGALLEMKTRVLSYVPLFNSAIAFFLLYMLVPNRKVRFTHALAGGVLAAVLFELAKRWFTFYVSSFATFEHIYGALSVVPMLFFWIYLEWVVVLTGAEFVFSLGYFRPAVCPAREFDPLQGLPEVVAVLRSVWRAQLSGSFMTGKKLLASEIIGDRSKLGFAVDFLKQNGILHQTADGGLAISADIHTVSLYDLYAKLPGALFNGDGCAEGGQQVSCEFEPLRTEVREALRSVMQTPLIALVNDSMEKDS
ncbi:YihY family inner membrane protein [Chlorobaculum sp. MV4-Y]|uniref:YihY family inner membrane protein n=1 Tax=Chlorobaculum sp. MV4-Y TaxID=2976335 RepID=UPI0021AEAE84|nr:YihY family inner membrane protein [Chlorobaculum sp. MV4-Y]UWX58301.1 YihY family inner membrane protein [Chlorobaculum sp. MV4-Y]